MLIFEAKNIQIESKCILCWPKPLSLIGYNLKFFHQIFDSRFYYFDNDLNPWKNYNCSLSLALETFETRLTVQSLGAKDWRFWTFRISAKTASFHYRASEMAHVSVFFFFGKNVEFYGEVENITIACFLVWQLGSRFDSLELKTSQGCVWVMYSLCNRKISHV